jgi:hypothetical protein
VTTYNLQSSKSINLINETALAASQTSPSIAMAGLYAWSLHLIFNTGGGTLAGSVAVQVSNDERANPDHASHSSAVWLDISSRITSGSLTITSGAGTNISFVEGSSVSYLRIVFTRSAGTGVLKVVIAGVAPSLDRISF